MAISDFQPLFLNERQRSVNRKVQGSNRCSGAKFRIGNGAASAGKKGDLADLTAILRQLIAVFGWSVDPERDFIWFGSHEIKTEQQREHLRREYLSNRPIRSAHPA